MSWTIVPVLKAIRGPRPASVPPRPDLPILRLTQSDRTMPNGGVSVDLSPYFNGSAYVRGYLDACRGGKRS